MYHVLQKQYRRFVDVVSSAIFTLHFISAVHVCPTLPSEKWREKFKLIIRVQIVLAVIIMIVMTVTATVIAFSLLFLALLTYMPDEIFEKNDDIYDNGNDRNNNDNVTIVIIVI